MNRPETKVLSNQEIVELYYRHPPETIRSFRRTLLTLRLICHHGPVLQETIQKLMVESYGYQYEYPECERDWETLYELKLIDYEPDQTRDGWVALPDTEFWPFDF